jgi:hypothetical protein
MNKSDLRNIIKEEITKVLNEESYDTLRDLKAAGVNPYNKSEVEKYLGRELSDSEYNGMLGRRSGRKQKTIVGRRNGRPIYSDGTVGESKTKDLYESNLKDMLPAGPGTYKIEFTTSKRDSFDEATVTVTQEQMDLAKKLETSGYNFWRDAAEEANSMFTSGDSVLNVTKIN